eukprot:7390707-Prymnesium_polylepis.1
MRGATAGRASEVPAAFGHGRVVRKTSMGRKTVPGLERTRPGWLEVSCARLRGGSMRASNLDPT